MEIEFETDPKTAAALRQLAKENGDSHTFYGVTYGGEIIPIANLVKHPDCPQDMFDRFVNAIKETGKL